MRAPDQDEALEAGLPIMLGAGAEDALLFEDDELDASPCMLPLVRLIERATAHAQPGAHAPPVRAWFPRVPACFHACTMLVISGCCDGHCQLPAVAESPEWVDMGEHGSMPGSFNKALLCCMAGSELLVQASRSPCLSGSAGRKQVHTQSGRAPC